MTVGSIPAPEKRVNAVFLAIVLVAFLVAAYRQVFWLPEVEGDSSPMEQLSAGMIEAAGLGQVAWRDLAGGIAAMHSAWRI